MAEKDEYIGDPKKDTSTPTTPRNHLKQSYGNSEVPKSQLEQLTPMQDYREWQYNDPSEFQNQQVDGSQSLDRIIQYSRDSSSPSNPNKFFRDL
ncbi:MAG: hypothetical protein IH845_02405 [Nanoarchaeota archaeon]|nr:hypothetical protein [Nanoarchaeota archaeon]